MKTRSGFVSNSSSSSFIVRGIKVNLEDFCHKVGIPFDEFDGGDTYDLVDALREKFGCDNTLIIHPNLNWFRKCDGDKYSEIIVGGNSSKGMDDGDVVGLDDDDKVDAKVRANLAKIGYETAKLSYWVQFVSNDNY
jgi:hypothetical protein